MVLMEWLRSREPGFETLAPEDLQAVTDFAFLWTLFEARALNTAASISRIIALAERWTNDPLDFSAFAPSLAYFKHRYFSNGASNYRFEALRLRPNDRPELVWSVLAGEN